MSGTKKNVDDNGIPIDGTKRPNEQKEENKYVKGSAKVSLADLNEITFKNAQAKKLLELAKQKERDANKPNNNTNTNTRKKLLSFGGNTLGGSRMKLHRKKKNRST